MGKYGKLAEDIVSNVGGQEVEISISGEDEELAYRGMTEFFQEYL